MTFYAGLDVALRTVAICVVDATGKVCLERTCACEVDLIAAVLQEFPSPIERVGFEAGAMSQHLFFGLQSCGFDVVCMEAHQVSAALSAIRNKTDKNDARGIAQLLRSGWFRPVHMKSRASHYVRALLTSRKTVLRKFIDLENEIRGIFKVFGIRLPPRVDHARFDRAVRDLILADADLAYALLPMLDARLVLYKTFRELDKRVKRTANSDPICRRLMTTPGVAQVVALTFKAAVDTPERFSSSRNVGAHFGLTPRRFQSGESDNPGRISHAGDPAVREALYAAAHSLMTRTLAWSTLKSWGTRLMRTKGRRRAVVAVARKLAVILHRMWADGTDFRWAQAEAAPMS